MNDICLERCVPFLYGLIVVGGVVVVRLGHTVVDEVVDVAAHTVWVDCAVVVEDVALVSSQKEATGKTLLHGLLFLLLVGPGDGLDVMRKAVGSGWRRFQLALSVVIHDAQDAPCCDVICFQLLEYPHKDIVIRR